MSSGALSRADAQRSALADLKAMRYDGTGGYLMVMDAQTTVLMHGVRSDLEGKDMSQFKDPTGRMVFKEAADLAERHGEDFIHTQFTKPGTNEMAPKINYLRLFKPWGWTIITGVFVDDIDSAFYVRLGEYLAAALLLCLGMSLFLSLIGRSIVRQLGGEPAYAADIVGRIADGELDITVSTRNGDERSLLAAMQRMQLRLAHAIEKISVSAQ